MSLQAVGLATGWRLTLVAAPPPHRQGELTACAWPFWSRERLLTVPGKSIRLAKHSSTMRCLQPVRRILLRCLRMIGFAGHLP